MSTKRITFLLGVSLLLVSPAASVQAQSTEVQQAEARQVNAAEKVLATAPAADKRIVQDYIGLLHQWYQSPLPLEVKVLPVERLFTIYADLLRSRSSNSDLLRTRGLAPGTKLTPAQRASLCTMYDQAIKKAGANVEQVKSVMAMNGTAPQPDQLMILDQLTGQQEALIEVLQADVVTLVMVRTKRL